MIKFFAERVINGRTAYADVPSRLKEGVREYLIEHGYSSLVEEDDDA